MLGDRSLKFLICMGHEDQIPIWDSDLCGSVEPLAPASAHTGFMFIVGFFLFVFLEGGGVTPDVAQGYFWL